MKVKPLFSYNEGFLIDAGGNALSVAPAQMRVGDLSAFSEDDIAALSAEGINLALLRIGLDTIAPAPDSFNEAALARLREILKAAEEKRIGAVLSIEPAANGLFISAAEHAARRLKDCAALIGFAVSEGAGREFLSELATRFEKKHPTLLFFVSPQAKSAAEQPKPQSSESKATCPAPFVSSEFWPQAWL